VAIKRVQGGSVAESIGLTPTLVLVSVQVCLSLPLNLKL